MDTDTYRRRWGTQIRVGLRPPDRPGGGRRGARFRVDLAAERTVLAILRSPALYPQQFAPGEFEELVRLVREYGDERVAGASR